MLVGAKAGAEPHVFDALYFVVGSVTANGTPPSPVAGRKVVFYKDSPATAIEATIDSNNKFVLNIYDNLMIPIDPASTYYVAIEKDNNNWGADPIPVTLKAEGWNNVNIILYDQTIVADTTPPIVKVESPNGGEEWQAYSNYNIIFTCEDESDIKENSANLYYSLDNGNMWTEIATGQTTNTPYSWKVPNIPTTQAKIRVEVQDNSPNKNIGTDESDAVFTINSANYIPLYISRGADTFNASILLTWETETTTDPVFYILTGEGSGVYTDLASSWIKLNGTNGFTIDYQNKTAIYTNQVGTGYSEAYFKALYPGAESEKDTLLPTATAVGKVNIDIPKDPSQLELAALPLIPANYNIDSVIGKQFGTGQAEVWGFYNAPLNKWGSEYYNGSTWSGSLPDHEMPPDRGYWIKSKTEAKTITIVGYVPVQDRTMTFSSDESLFLYGNSYPKTTAWETSGLSDVLIEKDKIWQWNGDSWESKIYLGNNQWGGADTSGLLFKHGFWINKQPKADTWIYKKPY